MSANGGGRIVGISSAYSLRARSGRSAYSSSKASLDSFLRTVALEYAARGILVNSVSPGFVSTQLTTANNSEAELAELMKKIPLGRFAQPKEVAKLVFFLGSNDNTYITGQSVAIDGGLAIQ
jgi:3-oxoacyl-[acyl-carrier protein] reductase